MSVLAFWGGLASRHVCAVSYALVLTTLVHLCISSVYLQVVCVALTFS